MNTSVSGPKQIKYTKGDNVYLAIPTGITGRQHALKTLTALKEGPGWIVNERGIEEWKFSGFSQIDEQIYVYGPYIPGKSLDEIIDSEPGEGLHYLLNLVRALIKLREKSIESFNLLADGVLFAENGDIVFLPPTIMNKIKDTRTSDYKIKACEMINHPYLKAEMRTSFSIAILLYRLIAGVYPFAGSNEEEIRDKIRHKNFTPPLFLRPEIREDVSNAIVQVFEKPESLSLDGWQKLIEERLRDDFFRNISEQEKESLQAKAEEFRIKSDRSLKKKLFFEKNGKLIIIIGVITVVVGYVVGGFIKRALEPRVTRGFSPQKVIEAFYTSINTFDHMTMEDCVIEKAGKTEITEAINLYVISKQTAAYEGKSYIVPADEWVKNGKPDLQPPYFVYGVVNLKITQESGGDEPVFIATYEKWSRAGEDTTPEINTTASVSVGRTVRDRLTLRQDKEDWVIFKLERLENLPIDN